MRGHADDIPQHERVKAVLPAEARPLLEPHLPSCLEVAWCNSPEEAEAMIADAVIAWVDFSPVDITSLVLRSSGPALKWVSTIYAGLDGLPLDLLRQRGVRLTNGAGINAIAVAEYAVLGILAAAKRYDQVVRLQDRHAWPQEAPGRVELFETKALVIGMGTIGTLVHDRLTSFGVDVTGVTRSGRDGTLTPSQWRHRLGEFDWVILAAPATGAAAPMIGAAELAAMKPTAWLVNMARGSLVDHVALVDALEGRALGGAFIDPTDPEPLPSGHPLWSAPDVLISMHLSGRSQSRMYARASDMFLRNLSAFLAGECLRNTVDLDAGY